MADGAPIAKQSANVQLESLAELQARVAPDTTLLRPL
jgi:hypothetical protein